MLPLGSSKTARRCEGGGDVIAKQTQRSGK